MAWFQNLADKAENLLNKIDQNAATVLNEPYLHDKLQENLDETAQSLANVIEPSDNYDTKLLLQPETREVLVENKSRSSLSKPALSDQNTDESDNVSVTSQKSKTSQIEICIPETNVFEKTLTLENSLPSSKSGSVHSSFIQFNDDSQKYEDRISVLEQQNQDLNAQLLNMQHLYCDVKNENMNLQSQLERANESIFAAKTEMEQYRVRAQRILQEKERLIAERDHPCLEKDDNSILVTYNEQLKKELLFQQEKNQELVDKLNNVTLEMVNLQQQLANMEKLNQQTVHNIEESLIKERAFRGTAEDELKLKTQEIQKLSDELSYVHNILSVKNSEIDRIKEQLRLSASFKGNNDLESRLHSLTQTLMSKQSTLETITTERNALRLQLEKLENEYHKLLSKIPHTPVTVSTVNDTDDAKSQVPHFMRVSPLDAGVTRRVKRAYTTLDAISVRTGIFLRRYPLARVFVFCYGVMLHFWVIIILLSYVPSGR